MRRPGKCRGGAMCIRNGLWLGFGALTTRVSVLPMGLVVVVVAEVMLGTSATPYAYPSYGKA
jgi:hypothetical protein